MLPTVSVAASCWSVIVEELDRVYPAEGILVPLLGLLPRDRRSTPCTPLELPAIDEIVIARVVRVPPERQLNTPCRVHALSEVDEIVNRSLRLARGPR